MFGPPEGRMCGCLLTWFVVTGLVFPYYVSVVNLILGATWWIVGKPWICSAMFVNPNRPDTCPVSTRWWILVTNVRRAIQIRRWHRHRNEMYRSVRDMLANLNPNPTSSSEVETKITECCETRGRTIQARPTRTLIYDLPDQPVAPDSSFFRLATGRSPTFVPVWIRVARGLDVSADTGSVPLAPILYEAATTHHGVPRLFWALVTDICLFPPEHLNLDSVPLRSVFSSSEVKDPMTSLPMATLSLLIPYHHVVAVSYVDNRTHTGRNFSPLVSRHSPLVCHAIIHMTPDKQGRRPAVLHSSFTSWNPDDWVFVRTVTGTVISESDIGCLGPAWFSTESDAAPIDRHLDMTYLDHLDRPHTQTGLDHRMSGDPHRHPWPRIHIAMTQLAILQLLLISFKSCSPPAYLILTYGLSIGDDVLDL